MRRRKRWLVPAVATAAILAAFWRPLPDPLFDTPVSSLLVARDGRLLGATIADDEQWRFPPSEHIPPKFSAALLTFEDRRFFDHEGVDPLALARAIRQVITERRVVSGASTITMQVIRLSRQNPPRTIHEKVVEMLLALRLERRLDKSQILALYASHAPFGGNVVGLHAASWRYYARSPETLSWAEAATLAVLPNSPSLIHPGKGRGALEAKRNRLLTRLLANGTITALELSLAKTEPLPDRPKPLPRNAPHLLDTLRARERDSRYRFETTLDPSLQKATRDVVGRHIARLELEGIHNAAAMIVDHRTLEVLAYVGNGETTPGQPQLGRAVDIIRRPRSTGSILKPLLYAAMLESGDILPGALVADVPTQYDGYMPENFDRLYRGAVRADEALAQSLNVPAVRMLRRYGVERFYDFLRALGLTTLHRSASAYGLPLILGGAETTIWDIAEAYANVARIASHTRAGRPAPYGRLTVSMEHQPEISRNAEIGPGSAWLTLEALLAVQRPGNERYWRAFQSSRRVAWKTGTSYGLRDGWAIGTTPAHTIAVWVGNASGEGRPGLTGARVAAPLLFDLLNRLEPAEWFPKPFLHLKQLAVCRADGYLAGGGCETESVWAPANSHFDRMSPFHRRVHLDPVSGLRVHGGCETPSRMAHETRFVLPAGMEYFYRRRHGGYRGLPSFRPDCRDEYRETRGDAPIAFLYPEAGTKLYIPVELGGVRGRTVFEAVHRRPQATLYWHLDERYLGETTEIHQQALDISAGSHLVTVVDDAGNRLARRFEVLGTEEVESRAAHRSDTYRPGTY